MVRAIVVIGVVALSWLSHDDPRLRLSKDRRPDIASIEWVEE